jgi:formylglycine-generating enzyme required for sulfatase activity
MISLRTEMTKLRVILVLAGSFGACTYAAAHAKAAPRAAGTVSPDCRACPETVVLPAGSFTMGSSPQEKSWAASHGSSLGSVADDARHQVLLPPFALGKYDVNRGEYATFAREKGYPAGDGCGRRPRHLQMGEGSEVDLGKSRPGADFRADIMGFRVARTLR